MNSNQEQVKKLHQKLNILQTLNPQNPKIKLTNIEDLAIKISQDAYQQYQLSGIRIKEMFQLLKKFQLRLKEQVEQNQKMEEQARIKINRTSKMCQRALQKMVKQKNDVEKKINTALQGFLLQLTSAKTKSSSAGKYALKQFENLQIQLNALQADIQTQQVMTKDIAKKIYAQFSTQIEELSSVLVQQKRQKQIQQQKIITRLQKMYSKLRQSIKHSSKQRQANEQQVVIFLQKVIQKVKYELLNK